MNRVKIDATKENKPMYLHAQLKAIPLYERCGFKKTGALFLECDIEHYKMVLKKLNDRQCELAD